MASRTLYPPLIESYLPAFKASGGLKLKFSLSKYSTVDATAITAEADTASVAAGAKTSVAFTLTPPNATTTVTATSSAEGKATVEVKGNKVEITGVEAGEATITLSAGTGITDTIAVTVTGE